MALALQRTAISLSIVIALAACSSQGARRGLTLADADRSDRAMVAFGRAVGVPPETPVAFYALSLTDGLRPLLPARGWTDAGGVFEASLPPFDGDAVLVEVQDADQHLTAVVPAQARVLDMLAVGVVDRESTIEAEIVNLALRNAWWTQTMRIGQIRAVVSPELAVSVWESPDRHVAMTKLARVCVAAASAWREVLLVTGSSPSVISDVDLQLARARAALDVALADAPTVQHQWRARDEYAARVRAIYESSPITDWQLIVAATVVQQTVNDLTEGDRSPIASRLRERAASLRAAWSRG